MQVEFSANAHGSQTRKPLRRNGFKSLSIETPWTGRTVGIEELDGYALRELVSAIYVDAPVKSSGKRVQHILIKYDGLGFTSE